MWVKIIISNALPTILNETYVFFVFLCINEEEFQSSGDYHFIKSPGVNKMWAIYIKFLFFLSNFVSFWIWATTIMKWPDITSDINY